ncbi:MAG TPA: retropepsin-like aspartic protease, partial [Bacteroidia bacterium]
MKRGEVEQKQFKVEVPFEMRLGVIVIKVNINGIDRDFIVDTGAPNVISKELSEELKLTAVTNRKTGDSQGNSSSLSYVEIKKITIGGINFLNTGAAVGDLKQSTEVGCLRVDGFIGANLMRKAIWQFDYTKQLITITSSMDSLEVPANADKINFYSRITGTPLADIEYNGVMDKGVTIDLGSNGDFSSSKRVFDK